jgi:ankyrin repeat protein
MLLLIDSTAAALLQDGDEVTQDLPLHVASASGHTEVVRLLLASGRCQVDPVTKVRTSRHWQLLLGARNRWAKSCSCWSG